MPTVIFNKSRLLEKLNIDEQKLEELLFNLKSESKIIDENNIEIEINADRPDLLISDGIKRAIDGLLERRLGEARYEVVKTDYELIVRGVKSRPYVLGAVVYGLKIDEEYLREIIQFQEKLHSTIGRKRKKVAIGLHDLDKIDGKTIIYDEVPIDYKFVPLGYDREMSIREVLEKTPQGKEYGNISLLDNKLPAILQSDGKVLSIPPVINSEKTRLDTLTKNLFIDVTGTSLDAVAQTLDILVTNFAESGAKIGIINVKSSYTNSSPLLLKNEIKVDVNYVNKVLGTNLSSNEMKKLLLKARLDVEIDDNKLKVTIPPYRVDLMEEIDIVEEVAMMIGYDKLEPIPYTPSSKGELLEINKLSNLVRELAIGARFEEVFNFTLISSRYLEEDYVKISNPVSEEYDAVRNSLIPSILLFLKKNQYVRFPVRIFEVGDVVIVDKDTETGYRNQRRLALAIMNSKVSYEELQAEVHEILRNLGLEPYYIKDKNKTFIEGRTARIVVNNSVVGIIGEVNPQVLESYEIGYPVVLCEIYLDKVLEIINARSTS